MRLLIFSLHDQHYGLHIENVERVLRAVEVIPVPDVADDILGVINVYGHIIPVLNVRRRLGLPDKEIDLADQMIVVHAANHPVALLVDGVAGVMDYAEEREVVSGSELIEGVVKLDGEVIFVQDLERLCAVAWKEPAHRGSGESP